jgi:hypothetical protein
VCALGLLFCPPSPCRLGGVHRPSLGFFFDRPSLGFLLRGTLFGIFFDHPSIGFLLCDTLFGILFGGPSLGFFGVQRIKEEEDVG